MNRKFLRDGLSHNFIAWILQLYRKTNSLQGTVPGIQGKIENLEVVY